jgi:hypothetical protein
LSQYPRLQEMRPRIYQLFKLQLNTSISVAILQTQILSTCKSDVLSSAGQKERPQCLSMLSAERHRSLVQNVPNSGRSELHLVDFKSTTMFRVSSVSTTEDDKFVTTCNVTFYLKQNLNRLSSSLTHSKYF